MEVHDWTLALIRFSISSMSYWEEGWSGAATLWTFSFFGNMDLREIESAEGLRSTY